MARHMSLQMLGNFLAIMRKLFHYFVRMKRCSVFKHSAKMIDSIRPSGPYCPYANAGLSCDLIRVHSIHICHANHFGVLFIHQPNIMNEPLLRTP